MTGFDNVLVERGLPVALAYRRLREMNGLSIEEVAARSGISEEEILKIETKDSGYQLFRHEAMLKKVWQAIVNKPKGSRR